MPRIHPAILILCSLSCADKAQETGSTPLPEDTEIEDTDLPTDPDADEDEISVGSNR